MSKLSLSWAKNNEGLRPPSLGGLKFFQNLWIDHLQFERPLL
nr:MAG TPA: hypothetical protein [Caudoviricetes sp.]